MRRQAGLARLVPKAGARWQAQEPAAADGPRAEPLAQDGRARPRLTPRGIQRKPATGFEPVTYRLRIQRINEPNFATLSAKVVASPCVHRHL